MNGEPRIEATMLLCDSAQSIAGKLFIPEGETFAAVPSKADTIGSFFYSGYKI